MCYAQLMLDRLTTLSTAVPPFPILTTASSFDRFLQCGGSATQQQVSDGTAAAAITGIEKHVTSLRSGGLPPAVVDWFGDAEPSFEVALAADCDSFAAVYLGKDIQRAYPLQQSPCWVAGTADMIQLRGSALSVGDLKTGIGQLRGDLPAPERSGQLLGLAWLACRWMRVLHGNWEPSRVRLMWWYSGGAITAEADIEDAEISWPQLRDWGEALEQAVRKAWALRGREHLQRGAHCGGCHSRDACPAYGGAVARVTGADSTSAQDYGEAFQDLIAAERACELTRDAIKMEVELRGALSSGDHAVRLVRGSDTRISVESARAVLGDSRFAQCCDVKLSQASLVRGLGAEGAEQAMEELRRGGALVTQPKAAYLKMGRVKR